MWKSNPRGFLVAYEEEKLAGYILFGVKDAVGLIISLAVRQEVRGRGHGDALLAQALDDMTPKVKTIQLQVGLENQSAISLYEKHGFLKQRILNSYYEGGRDAYLMIRHNV